VKQQQYEQQEVQLIISTVFKGGQGWEQPKGKEKKTQQEGQQS
jgi:hypothetical protein